MKSALREWFDRDMILLSVGLVLVLAYWLFR